MSNLSEEEIKKLKCIHLADRRTTDKLCPAIEELKKEKEKVDRLQKELDKKNKVINLIAKSWKQDDVRSVEEIKEYFYKKVEGV